ncbi:glutamine synthetase family protein [Maritimibacter fusiformis]|uniref:Glutamine synthetase n=1 Tax=Maritimibacter fusiformis TaxID=2603819 RepID=A0A5D0RG18_9RHOB|nr:glutamine synthetase family protein [Maritimibacter fusiformis]TYB80452.1 glutamine synthetase [Maritimibacter fusiformis]
MTDFLQEYAAHCEEHGRPDRVELMLCDINAVLRGKWLPGDDEEKIAEGGVRLPLSTYAPNILGEEVEATGLGIAVGDPDGRLFPVPGSLRPVPWAAKDTNVAQVLVEMHDDTGEVSFLSPRHQLETMLGRFRERGLNPVVATELEFYLYKPREAEDDAPVPPDRSPMFQNYDLEVLERTQAILDDILDGAIAQGMAPDTLIAEYGPGQFEINFHHTDDVLEAADSALIFRRLVRGTARKHGMSATFMAKPYADNPGNGMHAHVSVTDASGDNIFDDGTDEPSARLKQAVAGVLATMPDLQAIFAPHMNSYRRFQAGSFAPHAPDWGLDNRAAGIRLPEVSGPGARLEHRISGADTNPYLVLTAILGGILYGLDNPDLPLPLPLDDDDGEHADPLTGDWTTAVDIFAESEIAADIFGTEYRDIYTAVRRDEIQQLTSAISQIEYRTYLGRL